MGPDEILDAIAAACHGLVTRRQLLAAGLSAGAIDRRLRSGRLVVVGRGVYRVRGHAETWEQRLLLASLATGGVVSHRGAAHLHGLCDIEPRAEVTVDNGRRPAPTGVIVHRSRQLDRADIEVVDSISRTRPARTVIDLAAVVRAELVDQALDHFLSRRLLSIEHLRRRLTSVGRQGRPGAALVSALLDQRSTNRPRSQSAFERRLHAVLRDAGLPPPVQQHEVALGNGKSAFVDFAWPELRLGLEADSYRHHSGRLDWERDRIRNRRLTALGWRILPVTWNDLSVPGALLAELRVADVGFRRLPLAVP